MRIVDITGQQFGRLTALKRIGAHNRAAIWLCRCNCGEIAEASLPNLRRGLKQSCGCLKREGNNYKHGENRKGKATSEYITWCGMFGRCYNPNNHKYPDYGGRGITVCERWLSYEKFLADMGRRPTGKMIDRINNNGNYEPGNCRWVTPKQSANNRRPRRY